MIKKFLRKITNRIFKRQRTHYKEQQKELEQIKKIHAREIRMSKDIYQIKRQLNLIEQLLYKQSGGGLNPCPRNPRIIVSMTSFPDRMWCIPTVVMNMANQTLMPDKIVLWLSEEQYPGREEDLPETIIGLAKQGILEIGWCEGDTKAYKKLLPALKKYPDDLIITVDDDLKYDFDMIEKLYFEHKNNPKAVIASRAHKIRLDKNGNVEPYEKWKKQAADRICEVEGDLFLTGGAGTLFPPGIFTEEIFDEEIFKKYAPYADDIWINLMMNMSGIELININQNGRLAYIDGTQTDRLFKTNITENDIQMKRLAAHYSDRLRGIWKNIDIL